MEESCKEGNLYDFLDKNGGNLTEQKAIQTLKKIVLTYSLLMEHYPKLNIKPENILFKNGIIKISDGYYMKTRVLQGKEIFIAPEVLENIKTMNESSYVWSIGLVLYLMLYGKL